MNSIHRLLGNSANSSAWENCFTCSRPRSQVHQSLGSGKTRVCLFLVSSVSLAQRVVTATANIPFDFWAEGQKFAAGEYTFDTGFPGSTSVHRKATKLTVGVPIIPYGDPVRKEDARVVFVLRDGNIIWWNFGASWTAGW